MRQATQARRPVATGAACALAQAVLVLGYVDADEDGGLFVHDPTLQMRA